ncbi:MAG: recombinase family protein [Rhodobiaceae bacterium]|nr:recombinase family protein [Rhodobiaceae bacterium]
MSGKKALRCAVYTRKSTDEGLEQAFNSLDAQREACEAYIASQASLGWKLLSRHYDDGGVSGGTMERPALQELLEDIRRGLVDIVVVYKIDRLTRSLMDFARIVEVFDASDVSFVSVTQQFNTTTSMGRLTLNVLLSFAQFEREVTAERIRDKIAASKKKGMWMGGPPLLGYDVRDKALVINAAEAVTVRTLFRAYLEDRSVRRLKVRADRQGITTKRRITRDGRAQGGKPFTRGNLYQLLSNPLYIGQVPHRGATYPGRHEAIVNQVLWDEVQALLKANTQERRSQSNGPSSCVLTGLLFDEAGDRLSPSYAVKGGVRYRYYISSRLMTATRAGDDGCRLPASEIERLVIAGLCDHLTDPVRLTGILPAKGVSAGALQAASFAGGELATQLMEASAQDRKAIFASFVERIDVSTGKVIIRIDRNRLARRLGVVGVDPATDIAASEDPCCDIEIAHTIRRRGVETKLVLANGAAPTTNCDRLLILTIAKARLWLDDLTSGVATSIDELARRHGEDRNEISRFLSLAHLAPDIVETILAGTQPVDLTREKLRSLLPLPADWREQHVLLGVS